MAKLLFAMMTSTALVASSPVLAADSVSGGSAPVGGSTDIYKKVLGQLPPGISDAITVKRDGDVTTVTIDLEQLAKPLADRGFKLTAKPITLIYTPQPDGTVKQAFDAPADLGVDMEMPINPKQTGSFTYQGITLDGVYDPTLAFYREVKSTIAKVIGDVNQEANGTSASVVAGPAEVVLNAEKAGDQAINIRETETIHGFTERVHVDPSKATSATAATGPGGDVDFKMPEAKVDFAMDGFRSFAIRDMFLFLLDNHTEPAIAAKQDEFKRHLRDLVPLLDTAKMSGELRGMTVQSAFGQGSIGSLGVNLALDTHTGASSFSVGEHFNDIKVDSVFLPEWSKSLVPTSLDVEANVTGFDIGGLLSKFADAMDKHDFANPASDTTDYQALGKTGIAPTGGVHIDLKPSSIVSPTYKISWTGSIDTHGEQAKSHIDVTATGLDNLVKTLTPVHDKGVPETIIGLYAAKALAKPGPDGSLVWGLDIDSQTNTFLVNGKPVGPKH